jgi:predicted DNA-binding transcriptional regulator AlpA
MPSIPPEQVSPFGSARRKQDVCPSQSASETLPRHKVQDRGPCNEEAEERYLSGRQVRFRCGGVSDMWIWRRLKDGSGFPKPVVVRGRRFWALSKLVVWERKLAEYPANQAHPSDEGE